MAGKRAAAAAPELAAGCWMLDVGLGAEPGIMLEAAAIPRSSAGPDYKIFRPLFVTARLTR